MTVKTILSAKGGDVISIEPTATLEPRLKRLPSIELAHFSCSVRIVG